MEYTIKDVAKMANVSIATVSRVLNGSGTVSKKTEKRIREIINELNYVPNNMARSLVTQKSKTIGVVVADIMNPFYSEIVRGIQDRADIDGYSVISCNSDEDMEKEKQCIRMLMENKVNGIIFAGGRGKGDYYNEHIVDIAQKIPVVLADEYQRGYNIYSIVCDKQKGAFDAVSYLIELGHKKIAIITGYQDYKPSIEKLNGYKDALKNANIKFDEKYVKYGDYHLDSGEKHVEDLMKMKNPPTAIFLANDLMAMGAIRKLNDLGYKVPDDVSIMGFDDIILNEYMLPTISSVRQEMKAQGELSVEILHRIFTNQKKIKKKYIIESKVMKRGSCAKCKDMK